MFFTTLVPRDFAVPVAKAHTFDPSLLSGWIAEHMGNLNYIGMIEPGFYPRLKLDLDDPLGTISWHAHTLVWGTTLKELKAVFEPLADSKSLLANNRAYHIKPIGADEAPRLALYGLKSSQKQYATWTSKLQPIDPDTGEVLQVDHQRSAILRTGQRIILCGVQRDQYLDRLLVSGGEGSAIAAEITQQALSTLRQDERLQDERRAGVHR